MMVNRGLRMASCVWPGGLFVFHFDKHIGGIIARDSFPSDPGSAVGKMQNIGMTQPISILALIRIISHSIRGSELIPKSLTAGINPDLSCCSILIRLQHPFVIGHGYAEIIYPRGSGDDPGTE